MHERASGSRRVRHAARALLSLLAAILMLAVPCGAPAADQSLPSDIEYQIKASFVYTVAKFVDWPDRVFPSPRAPLTLGIVGSEEVSNAIASALRGKRVHDRDLVVRRMAEASDTCDCQILYVSGSDPDSLAVALGRWRSVGVLTVGESDDFTRRGGILELEMHESLVQFEVNIGAAQQAGLVISSKILRLGHVVGGAAPAGGGRR